jgi:hypothetical protein
VPIIGVGGYVDDVDVSIQPSAKALGKQRAIETDSNDCMYLVSRCPVPLLITEPAYSQYARDSGYYDTDHNRRNSHSFDDSDHEDHLDPPWRRPTHYVYDAAAERTAERMREEYEQQALLVHGVR